MTISPFCVHTKSAEQMGCFGRISTKRLKSLSSPNFQAAGDNVPTRKSGLPSRNNACLHRRHRPTLGAGEGEGGTARIYAHKPINGSSKLAVGTVRIQVPL